MCEYIPIIIKQGEALSFKPKNGFGCIYQYLLNDKYYVGQTISPLIRRHQGHTSSRCNIVFDRFLKKYDYKIQIVQYQPFDELDNYESYFINKYNQIYPNGYNFTSGGNSKRVVSDQARYNMHIAQQKRVNSSDYVPTMLGKKLSEEAKKKISQQRKNMGRSKEQSLKASITMKQKYQSGYTSPMLGKKHTEECKEKISKTVKDKNLINYAITANKKRVAYYTIDGIYLGEFESIKDACIYLGYDARTSSSHISECANGKRKTAKGYIWRFI